MAIDGILGRCLETWRRENIPLAPPIPEAEVRRVWQANGHGVSNDVLALYSAVGGFADWYYEEDFFWCLWPWNGLQEVNREEPGEGMLFCDHSVRLITWELRFEDESHSSVWIRDPDCRRKVVPNLESFFLAYVDDRYKLF